MTTTTNQFANLERLFEISYGDVVPFSDYPNNDWADVTTFGVYGAAFTSVSDREDGRNFPVFQNEQDLARIRAQVRRFLTVSELTEAATTALRVYIFGRGISLSVENVQGARKLPDLIDAVRRLVEQFAEHNALVNSLDLELHRRSIDDGETQIALEKDSLRPGQICAEFVEADQLREPRCAGDHDFLNWLADQFGIDCSSFVPSWSFGVLTPQRRTSRALGYHVIYDGTGRDWDFYPADQFVHLKKNATRNMKRGISDWYCVKDRVAQSAKLVRNMAHAAALQSAIAWIEQSPNGTQMSQLQSIGNVDGQYPKPTNIGAGGGNRIQKQTTYGPGSILRPTPGRQYVPGPMGSERNNGFEIVEQMIERLTATRFLMPYYMISGDASNNNFASSLVAESPFVKAREADQNFYGNALESLLWKVVTLGWRSGWLDTCGLPFARIKEFINIRVRFPQVATRDRTALVNQLVQEVTILGTTSRRTAATDLGRDFDEELANGAAPDSRSIVPPENPPDPDGSSPRTSQEWSSRTTADLGDASADDEPDIEPTIESVCAELDRLRRRLRTDPRDQLLDESILVEGGPGSGPRFGDKHPHKGHGKGNPPKENARTSQPAKIPSGKIASNDHGKESIRLTVSFPRRIKELNTGINGSYVATLENGERGVWKPESEEDPYLRRLIGGPLYVREAVASSVAHAIGLDDLVPTTVTRTMMHKGTLGIGSLQKFVPRAKEASKLLEHKMFDGDGDLARAAAFDVLTSARDRHAGNWLLENARSTINGKLVLIDHGLTFPERKRKFVSFLAREARRRRLAVPREVLTWNEGKIRDAMRRHGLSKAAQSLTMQKLEILKAAARSGGTFHF